MVHFVNFASHVHADVFLTRHGKERVIRPFKNVCVEGCPFITLTRQNWTGKQKHRRSKGRGFLFSPSPTSLFFALTASLQLPRNNSYGNACHAFYPLSCLRSRDFRKENDRVKTLLKLLCEVVGNQTHLLR